jgi:hypothetical protein
MPERARIDRIQRTAVAAGEKQQQGNSGRYFTVIARSPKGDAPISRNVRDPHEIASLRSQ